MAQVTVNMDTVDLRKAETTIVKGKHVDNLQGLLKATRKADQDPGTIDGLGGKKTRAAVGAFQGANSLSKDYIVGPLTWGKLIAFGS
jgi:peptidoglycan hydrolase-like protein with peptidoglycan-binding domain